jgi:uncharacterized protein YlxW (UPF0749 family)
MEGVQMSQINNTGMLEMMRGTPPPTWEQTCLKLSEEKRELQSDVNELKELVEYLQDRIRKLKKAGDDLDSWLGRETPVTVRINWRQVKEGKQ